jgi:hypothetical protein
MGTSADGKVSWTGPGVLIEDCQATAAPPPDPELPQTPLAGDLFAALAARIGVERAVKYIADKLGVDCGCDRRRRALNQLHATVRRFLGRK